MWVYAHDCRCLQRPEEGTEHPGPRITSSFEMSIVGAEKQARGPLQEQQALSRTEMPLLPPKEANSKKLLI